jgi:hypothetical protein
MASEDSAEKLIAAAMASHGMGRSEAVVAVVTLDSRERHFGRPPLVDGPPLAKVYFDEMQGELTEAQAVSVVAYLQGISIEEAALDLAQRVGDGSVTFETKH